MPDQPPRFPPEVAAVLNRTPRTQHHHPYDTATINPDYLGKPASHKHHPLRSPPRDTRSKSRERQMNELMNAS